LNLDKPISSDVLFMNPGDWVKVHMKDTPSGFKVSISDLTTGKRGVMVASTANGFKHVIFNPNAPTCTSQPYAFHPMYATSSEHTSLTWTVHSYNVAVADEIGHFEYCAQVSGNGTCLAGASDPGGADLDDSPCGIADLPFVPIGGCIGTDTDFDGVSYQRVWPGTVADPVQDHLRHPKPITFTSAQFVSGGVIHAYKRVGFEADLPAIESQCDTGTGDGCTLVPAGANFYPTFSTAIRNDLCVWQLGGLNIPGTTNTFGGSAEWGSLLQRTIPTSSGAAVGFEDFRNVLSTNPCR
jgi:hypothetical protein